ncbi:DUF4231 domain-containing protein [Amycolatopsis sp. NBC_00345]|uniref:DUF4231 domain-containing protein n=1 Tax=Amycolatopsis sp. NBC_00345 TaxID=2975955 RepID=UPI002E26D868
MAAESYRGESFVSWLKRTFKAPTYRNISDDEPSRSVRRIVIRTEIDLKKAHAGRVAALWIAITFAAALVALVLLENLKLLTLDSWLHLLLVSVAAAAILGAVLLALIFSWNCATIRENLALMREFYNERVADELGVAEQEDDELKLLKVRHQYRESASVVIDEYRQQAAKYKRRHDRFQTITIIGSVVTSAITTASVSFSLFRVAAIVISLVVGIATGINGYYKFRERSFNLQQASDSVEREYNSVQLRVGKYAHCSDEADAYRFFCQQVEMIRDEQAKRQQQLEQPVETKKE